MKFNIEVEIDWIDEENQIDDLVKNEVVSGLITQIRKHLDDSINTKALEALNPHLKEIPNKIDALVEKTYDEMISNTVNITDKYGDHIESINVRELVKRTWDNFLKEKVDSSGSRSTYGDATRVQYMINEQIKEQAKEFTDETTKKVKSEIIKVVNENFRDKLGGELMDLLKVNKLLGLPEAKKQ